jgi:hypothetical protein
MLSNIIILLLKSPPHFLFSIPHTHSTILFAFLTMWLVRDSFVEGVSQVLELVHSFYFPSFTLPLKLFTQHSLPAFSPSHTFPGFPLFLSLEGRNTMYSSSTKVVYATDITLGRIVGTIKKLSSATQKDARSFVIAGASTACRLVAFSATFGYCLLRIVRLSLPLSWEIIPIVK